jgi:hypothetical protein
MLEYHIQIPCDEEFGVPQSSGIGPFGNTSTQPVAPEGISHLRVGGNSSVNPMIFQNKDFFKPVLKLLNYNKRFKDITKEEFKELFTQFGTITGQDTHGTWDLCLDFHPDNECDLSTIYFSKEKGKSKTIDRVCFQYKNSPVNSFYCMDDGKHVTIELSPYSKSYWTITDTEWWYFVEYLKKDMSLVEKRDMKLRELLDDNTPNYANIIRQLGFIVENDRGKSNSFFDSVYSYYEKNGFITKRQADKISESIW